MNAYERRFEDPADRVLLEENIQARIDGLGDSGGQLLEPFTALRDRLNSSRSPEEIAALADLDALEEMLGYVVASRNLAEIDLAALDPDYGDRPAAEREAASMQRSLVEADVHIFESQYAA